MFRSSNLKYTKNIFCCLAVSSFLQLNNVFKYKIQNFEYPSTKQMIRGEYENKIRMNSTPEKIFEIFATTKKDKTIYMNYQDIFRAICPFNYTVKKPAVHSDNNDENPTTKAINNGELDVNQNQKNENFDYSNNVIIEFVDTDKDGLISVYEFYYLVLILQANDKTLQECFLKACPEGELNKNQFKAFIKNVMNSGTTSHLTITKLLPDPRKHHLSSKGFEKVEDEIINNLYKNKEKISTNDFFKLRNDMFKEIYKYEVLLFCTFEHDDQGCISGEDFAKSIICYLSPGIVKKYLKSLDHITWKKKKYNQRMTTFKFLIQGKINLEEYIAFQDFLRLNYSDIVEKLAKKPVITRKRLKKLIHDNSVAKGTPISDIQLEIFIKVLDTNGNNLIDRDEFIGVVQHRTFYGNGENRNILERPFTAIEKASKRWIDKTHRIWEIVMEN